MASKVAYLVANPSKLNFRLPRIETLQFPIPPSVGLFALCGLMLLVVLVRVADPNFRANDHAPAISAVTPTSDSKSSQATDKTQARTMIPANKEMIRSSRAMIQARTMIPANKEMIRNGRATA